MCTTPPFQSKVLYCVNCCVNLGKCVSLLLSVAMPPFVKVCLGCGCELQLRKSRCTCGLVWHCQPNFSSFAWGAVDMHHYFKSELLKFDSSSFCYSFEFWQFCHCWSLTVHPIIILVHKINILSTYRKIHGLYLHSAVVSSKGWVSTWAEGLHCSASFTWHS